MLFCLYLQHQKQKYFLIEEIHYAKVAQLVEHDLAKVGVASSNLVFRSRSLPLSGRDLSLKGTHLLGWWNW